MTATLARYGMKDVSALYHRHVTMASTITILLHFMILGLTYALAPLIVQELPHSHVPGPLVDWIPQDPPVLARPIIVGSRRIGGVIGNPVPVPDIDIKEEQPPLAPTGRGDIDGTAEGSEGGGTTAAGGTGVAGGDGIVDLTNDFGAPIEKYPIPIREAKPEYPEIARRLGVEGTVVVELLISKEGKPQKVEIFSSQNELFNEATMQAAMKWLFIPAVMNKGTVAVWATVPFRFRLNR